MARLSLSPDTTLFPVPVVLLTSGKGDEANVTTINRISSCNAEPPMLAVSLRPNRHSHDLIRALCEFAINIPTPDMKMLTDYVGVTTGRDENKWEAHGLTPIPASLISPPLIEECPVNLECTLVETIKQVNRARTLLVKGYIAEQKKINPDFSADETELFLFQKKKFHDAALKGEYIETDENDWIKK